MAKRIPYKENHRTINGQLYKKCNKHDIYFPDESPWMPCTEEYYYKNERNKTDGLNTWCIKCSKIKAMIWQDENRERRNELQRIEGYRPQNREKRRIHSQNVRDSGYMKNYYNAHKEQYQKYDFKYRQNKSHQITEAQFKECLEFFNHSCAYCEITQEEHKNKYNQRLHRDHAKNNGDNGIINCLPSCKVCNSSKRKKDWDEWYTPDNKRYTKERYNRIMYWLDYVMNK